jgi:hypothetical protein
VLNLVKKGGGGIGWRPAVSCEEGCAVSRWVRDAKYLDQPWNYRNKFSARFSELYLTHRRALVGGYFVLLIEFKRFFYSHIGPMDLIYINSRVSSVDAVVTPCD